MKLIVDTYVYLECKDTGRFVAISPAVNEGKVRMRERPGRREGKNRRKKGPGPSKRENRFLQDETTCILSATAAASCPRLKLRESL